jgi:hypothetical protein
MVRRFRWPRDLAGICLLWLLTAASTATGREIYVNNQTGDDQAAGLDGKPLTVELLNRIP